MHPSSFFDTGENGFDGDDFLRVGAIIALVGASLRWVWRRIRQGRVWTEGRVEKYVEGVVEDAVQRAVKATTQEFESQIAELRQINTWYGDVLETITSYLGLPLPPRPEFPRSSRTRATD